MGPHLEPNVIWNRAMLARTTPAASILRGLFHDFDQSSVLPPRHGSTCTREHFVIASFLRTIALEDLLQTEATQGAALLTLDGALRDGFDLGFGFLGLGCGRLCHVLGLGCG